MTNLLYVDLHIFEFETGYNVNAYLKGHNGSLVASFTIFKREQPSNYLNCVILRNQFHCSTILDKRIVDFKSLKLCNTILFGNDVLICTGAFRG